MGGVLVCGGYLDIVDVLFFGYVVFYFVGIGFRVVLIYVGI